RRSLEDLRQQISNGSARRNCLGHALTFRQIPEVRIKRNRHLHLTEYRSSRIHASRITYHRSRFPHHLWLQHSDKWQVAIAFRKIESVPDDEQVGNRKPNV